MASNESVELLRLDNSRAKAFNFCPAKFQERYVYDIEPIRKTSTAFGTRMHQLLQQRHEAMKGTSITAFPPCADQAFEDEAQTMFALYEATYPEEPFEIVDVEKFFEVPLPDLNPNDMLLDPYRLAGNRHTYIGEFDGIVRDKTTGTLHLLEHKTERRGSKDNLPDVWASKSQVGLYLWAAEQIYGEKFGSIILNILTRQSPAGREQPVFRRDNLQRTDSQQLEAVNNIVYVADQVERVKAAYGEGRWPQNRENCVSGFGWHCDFYEIHIGDSRPEDLIQIKFQKAEEYLAL